MSFRCSLMAAFGLLCLLGPVLGSPAKTPPAGDPLVDLAAVDDTICIELRYASARNIVGRPLYSPRARCIVRLHVAEGLKIAQAWLSPKGYGLKIWDAYRPPAVQQALWELSKNRSFIAHPETGRPLHTVGAAVDVTLVDAAGKEMKMPTDLDDFSRDAAMRYRGRDLLIARNLRLLQKAMGRGGFLGMRTEWWHFVGKHWRTCKPAQVDSLLPGKNGRWTASHRPSDAERQPSLRSPGTVVPQRQAQKMASKPSPKKNQPVGQRPPPRPIVSSRSSGTAMHR